jgi:Raf kinase inhibitor-like YbhB/YbcL family protein
MKSTTKAAPLTIGSTVFVNKGFIPPKYTCEGENVNPPLTIENIPDGTKSLALIVDDPDAPKGTFDHWIIWNIRPMEMILENTVPGIEGKNSFGKMHYNGPCPPGVNAHRYFFKVYALDKILEVQAGANKKTVEKAMKEHILAQGEIIGMYRKVK